MSLEIKLAYRHTKEIKELFAEYTELLVEAESSFGTYLDIQDYDAEIEDLETKYGLPDGRLYIAFSDGQAAGCIALKPLDGKVNCELKRLYVRPGHRGKKIAKALVETIIRDAVQIGFSHMLLDTLPALEEAMSLYKSFGFYEIPSYNNSPVDSSIFMRLDLKPAKFVDNG
ncbi:MAG: GNAT family N-acetyltransferase [Clostridiales bacterium]|nr:GNAT family N-acetyltransferase [Clostridiales bacterium]